jgi:peroxiredoxin
MDVLTATKGLTVTTVCLLTCALSMGQAPAPSAGRGEWLLAPRLARGQEYTYAGWYTEEWIGAGVQGQRSYRLEGYLLVLDQAPRSWDVAFLTVLSQRAHKPGQEPAAPSSVRLELAEVDAQGRLKPRDSASLAPPLDGPPTAECGAFVEAPRSVVSAGHFWEVSEPGRPPRAWRVAGTESVNGTVCVKLQGQQQSADWDRPRADSTAWRRQDTVWLAPQHGLACKVERVIERRDPARREPTYRSTVRYELDSRVSYPGRLFDDARAEIERALKFQQEAAPLLRQPALYKTQIEGLLKRIAHHLQQPPTAGPYRKAVLQVQHRVEAARRGEVTPEPQQSAAGPPPTRAALGQRVPDFVATELIHGQTARLYRMLGRPVLLVFYNPATEMGKQVLQFGQQVSEKHRVGVTVLALAVSDDDHLVRQQHADMKLSFPVLDGRGLLQTYGVDATPRLVVLDAEGIYRGGYTGWGGHTGREVIEELQRWLPK